MQQTHFHLFITHLPVYGVALGLLVLLFGIAKRNTQVQHASYYLLIIASLAAIVAFITGESAEEVLEHVPGVSEKTIEMHEEAGKYVLISFIPLGLLAIAGMVFSKKMWVKYIPFIVSVLCLFSFAAAFRSASLGGKIRHTELTGASVPEGGHEESEMEEREKANAPVAMPADGGKWAANPETKTAIDNMLQRVNGLPDNPSTDEVLLLQKELEHEFDELVNECTMTGEAHEQLHNYILPLREQIAGLDTEPVGESIPPLRKYLETFWLYFR